MSKKCPPDTFCPTAGGAGLSIPSCFKKQQPPRWGGCCFLEQGTGIEPAFTAWEAVVLPIYEPCMARIIAEPNGKCNHFLSNVPLFYPPDLGHTL